MKCVANKCRFGDRFGRHVVAWLGAAALSIGATIAVGATANAAGEVAFAVIDCNNEGDQFMLADGKANESDWKVEAINADGESVGDLAAKTAQFGPVYYMYRFFTVPADSPAYDHVLFTNIKTSVTAEVKPVVEDCATMNAVDFDTEDPGAGLVPATPIRVLETRASFDVVDGKYSTVGSIKAGGIVEVPVLGKGDIPADASAVLLNVAAVQPQTVGHVRAFPCGTDVPKTSNLNYIEGETRAANVFVKPGANGKVCLYTSAQTHLIADTQGYVAAKRADPVAIKPIRIADTRPDAPVDGPGLLPKKKVDGLVTLDMTKLAAISDIPADANGYVINITTANASGRGHVSANLCEKEFAPSVISSSVNFIPGRAAANLSYATNGDKLCLLTSGAVDLIVDVTGYTFSDYASPSLLDENLRLLETRVVAPGGRGTVDGKYSGVGRLAAGTEYKLEVTNRLTDWGAGVPKNVSAAVLNITAVQPETNGHVTAYECGKKPATSNVNIRKGDATANLALVPVGADGKVCLYTNVATDLVVDVTGFVSTGKTPMTADPITLSQAATTSKLAVVGGKAPYTLGGDLPTPVNIAMDASGMITFSGPPNSLVHYVGKLQVTDAAGQTTDVVVVVDWYPTTATVEIPPPVPSN